MGLGPPVCVECGVIASLSEGKGWRCPNCSDTKLPGHLWMFSKEDQAKLEVNTNINRENKTFPDK